MRGDRKDLQLVAVAAWLLGLQVGCAQPKTEDAKPPTAKTTSQVSGTPSASTAASSLSASSSTATVVDAGPPEPAQIDPDGNDEPEDPGTGSVPEKLTIERAGTPPLALTRICDLTVLGDALYMAHANQPLGTDGATITRYRPSTDPKKSPFSVAFDWNRPGEPTKGGGAGQGFLRIRKIDGKLLVPDSDPPYGGLGVVDWGTEGYVFRSDEQGVFAKPRMPNFKPPEAAGVLPRAYHVLDVIKFKGAIYASTGSVPPTEKAWKGPAPGALHKANADLSRWTYETDYPFPWNNDVTRVTFMVRFKDRLYAGFQAFNGGDPNDFVYWTEVDHEHRHGVRVTKTGSAQTLRWWVDTGSKPHRLYWLSWARDGILLRVSTDGNTWKLVDLPDDAGRPTDITRFRDSVVVLTERGLHKLDAETGTTAVATLAKVEEKKSPFTLDDYFCTAPLAVFENQLYAGGQRGGSLYRFRDGQ